MADRGIFGLDGKVAVVTGGSRGIGLMIARGLLEAGARVYISSRKEAELDDAVAELSDSGPIYALPADVSTAEGVARVAAWVEERETAVHALFNNAGAAWSSPIEEFPDAGFDKVMDLNVKSAFMLTRAFLPLLTAGSRPEDPSRVINTGSIDGIRPPMKGMNNFSYSASKAALHMLTRHLAGEFAPSILVNAIAPGLFESKMTKVLMSNGEDAIGASLPLKRIGKPIDMAGIAVFLASPASSYITGAVIPVDGGVSTVS